MDNDNNPSILGFNGEYRWLSNFWEAKIVWRGKVWPTVEHAYQAAKFGSPTVQEEIRSAPTPGKAKRMGREYQARIDWDGIKRDIMHELSRCKYEQHQDLRRKLLATGTRPIVEVNSWGDYYWGTNQSLKGRNLLGFILMNIRDQLRSETGTGDALSIACKTIEEYALDIVGQTGTREHHGDGADITVMSAAISIQKIITDLREQGIIE